MDQIDLSILLDRSNSMNWHDDYCRGVIDTLPPFPPPRSSSACWELFTRYVVAQAQAVAATVMPNAAQPLGWADDYPSDLTPARGLRVSVWGFACALGQRKPIVLKLVEQATHVAGLLAAMNEARVRESPDGGTCPGKAIEAAVRLIESTAHDRYPAQAAVYVTDGVVYDEPAPQRAVKGLHAYDVATFSVGVAVPKGTNTQGLTPAEIKEQRTQLLAFANNKPQNVFAFAEEGFDLLTTTIAQGIARQIPDAVLQDPPIPRYTWCGWRRKDACRLAGFRLGSCRWLPGRDEYGCRGVELGRPSSHVAASVERQILPVRTPQRPHCRITSERGPGGEFHSVGPVVGTFASLRVRRDAPITRASVRTPQRPHCRITSERRGRAANFARLDPSSARSRRHACVGTRQSRGRPGRS